MANPSVGTAPAKAILFGEHAVVYGHPAIAIPLSGLRSKVTITDSLNHSGVLINAIDLGLKLFLKDIATDHPIRRTVELFCQETKITLPPITVQLQSDIPIASGLGSGAAITVALIRALSNKFNHNLSNPVISEIAYEIEKIYHGSPSGIDNTVITYEQPIWFIRQKEITPFSVNQPLHFLIANSGISTPTIQTVADVRNQLENSPKITSTLLQKIGELTQKARKAIQEGDLVCIGEEMLSNHHCLQSLNVSCSRLDEMVALSMQAGAYGAKLSGGGRGGNMVALVNPQSKHKVIQALNQAGITEIYSTILES